MKLAHEEDEKICLIERSIIFLQLPQKQGRFFNDHTLQTVGVFNLTLIVVDDEGDKGKLFSLIMPNTVFGFLCNFKC